MIPKSAVETVHTLTNNRTLESQLTNGGTRVRLALGEAVLSMSAEDIDSLIGALGVIRAEMSPAVPASVWGTGARVHTLQDLNICDLEKGAGDPMAQGALITARSAMFGWQQFVLQPEACRGLAAWLEGKREHLPLPAPAH